MKFLVFRFVSLFLQQHRTTMILLCEDGSLRIYMANVNTTNFWLSPYLQPQSPIAVLKPVKKKRSTKSGMYRAHLIYWQRYVTCFIDFFIDLCFVYR